MDYRERITRIERLCNDKVDDFLKILNYVYSPEISNAILGRLLRDRFVEVYLKNVKKDGTPSESLDSIAYTAALYIFETLLEKECGLKINGHFQAQKFASLFNT